MQNKFNLLTILIINKFNLKMFFKKIKTICISNEIMVKGGMWNLKKKIK